MKIAVAVHDLGAGQMAFLLIKRANELVGSRPDADVVALYEAVARPCLTMNFAAMQLAEGWGFDGPVVATTLSTAEKVLRFPSASRKLFYCWDLDWLRPRQKSFARLRAVYGHPELTLVARGEDHAAALRQCWGREVAVVEDFDVARLAEVAAA